MNHVKMTAEDEHRRRFLVGTGAVVVGSVCTCASQGCKLISGVGDTPELPEEAYKKEKGSLVVYLDRAKELSSVGGAVKIRKMSLIIARTGTDAFLAASLKCTHGGRELEYKHGSAKLRCVSFGHSEFDLNGARKKGPAKKPIKVYKHTVDSNRRLIVDLE